MTVHTVPRVALAAFGRPTFDLEAARIVLGGSARALRALPLELVAASELLTDPAAAGAFARDASDRGADLMVCQFTTFVDDRFIAAAAIPGGPPVALWALREAPPVGARLGLNSLTGANLAGARLARARHPFRFAFGNPDDPTLQARLAAIARAAAQARRLTRLSVLVVGDQPDGFTFATPGNGRARVAHLPLATLFARARAVPEEQYAPLVAAAASAVRGLDALPQDQVAKFAQALAVVSAEVERVGADAVAVRCWPEFFTEYGAAACSLVSALNDRGVAAACEADVLGAMTMDLLSALTGGPAYLGDLAAIDEARNAAVFWHCGAGAFRLATPRTGAVAGRHPNRQMGFTLEFALKPGTVTIARLGETEAGLRLLVGGGEALDAPQRFLGTAATVRLDGATPLGPRVGRLIEAGWEPHYALAYGDVRGELEDVAALAGIPCVGM